MSVSGKVKVVPFGRFSFWAIMLLLCSGLLAGCGRGGGGGGANPAEGSNWDEMVWDQGTWG